MKLRRSPLAVVAAAALAVVAGGFGIATAQAATAACSVSYKVTSQWAGGFGADVAITNLGDAVTGWTLGWTLASGQTVTQAWNAAVTVAGTAATATNVSYNGSIGAGASVSFGFTGSWSGSNPVPTSFTFNGVTCAGLPAATTTPQPPTPTPTPCTGPSTPPVTAPTSSAPAPVKVWMAGDSTMMNAGACPIGWGSQFAPYFTGDVTVKPLFDPNGVRTFGSAEVSFTPCARTAWHTHPAGQTLVVTSGTGWIQQWDGAKQAINPGDVIWTPPGVKHWHGATDTTSMTHLAIQASVDGSPVDWMEHVTDAEYNR